MQYMRERPIDMDQIIRDAHAASRARAHGTHARTGRRPQRVTQPSNSSSPLSASEQQRGSHVPTSSPNTTQSPESPPEPARPDQAPDPSRVPSEAESFKENDGGTETATLRRPEGQSRAFGNDITQFEEDERKRSEDVAANRQQ